MKTYSVLCALFLATMCVAEEPAANPAEEALAGLIERAREELIAVTVKQEANRQIVGNHLEKLIASLEMIRAALEVEDLNAATQQLRSVAPAALPKFSTRIFRTKHIVESEIERREAAAVQNQFARIDRCIEEAREILTGGPSQEELDALLVKSAALSIDPGLSRTNPAAQRYHRKLEGLTESLSQYAAFLQFRAAGKFEQANAVIESLMNSKSLPVVDIDELQTLLQTPPDAGQKLQKTSDRDVIALFERHTRLKELSALLKELRAMRESEIENMSSRTLNSIIGTVEQLQRAHRLLGRGLDPAGLIASVDELRVSHLQPVNLHLQHFKEQLTMEGIASSAPEWWELRAEPSETLSQFFSRAGRIAITGGRLDMMQVLSEIGKGLDGAHTTRQTLRHELEAAELMRVASRLDESGDRARALSYYRRIVEMPEETAAVPMAKERLAALIEENPDLAAEPDVELLELVKALRSELNEIKAGLRGLERRLHPRGSNR